MREKDLLLIARNDHSIKIYDQLDLDGSLDFSFLTFKVFPKWSKWFFSRILGRDKVSRMKFAHKGDFHSCYTLTFLEHMYYIKHKDWARRYLEKHHCDMFERMVAKALKRNRYKFIHYWPYYSHNTINNYKKEHPEVITVADLYCPSFEFINRLMAPVYEKYGLENKFNNPEAIEYDKELLRDADNIFANSQFVIDTYKGLIPVKNYQIVSYGIFIDPEYVKKPYISGSKPIKDFVYCGGSITLEKGCDRMLEFFATHPEYNLHIFGGFNAAQRHIFEKYSHYENIIFHGHVPSEELQGYIREYDVGIHFSRFDAYSLSVAKMIGAGLPVIVSDHTGNMDDIRLHGFGEVISCEGNSIEDAIVRLSAPEQYNKVIDNIDAYISSSPLSYGERLVNLYKKSINNGSLQ